MSLDVSIRGLLMMILMMMAVLPQGPVGRCALTCLNVQAGECSLAALLLCVAPGEGHVVHLQEQADAQAVGHTGGACGVHHVGTPGADVGARGAPARRQCTN